MTNLYLEKVAANGFWTAADKISKGMSGAVRETGKAYTRFANRVVREPINIPKPTKRDALAVGVGAGAGLGIRALAKKKVDESNMTKVANIYLEKIAEDHKLKGLLSPAWQARAIAKEHGKQGDEGVIKHVGGGLRYGIRSGATAVGGAFLGGAAGAGLGKVLKKPGLAGAGAAMGYIGGAIRGAKKSLKNQANEAHAKYDK